MQLTNENYYSAVADKAYMSIESGQRYGRLVTIKMIGKNKNRQNIWLCKCDCGNPCVTISTRLLRGKTRSCGCLKVEGNNKRHGDCYSRAYRIYEQMKGRCYRKTSQRYKDYGGRGIEICPEWLGKDGFKNFMEWSMNNGYSDDLSIDRIDNDKGYSPDNCRWTNRKTQGRNTRRNHLITIDGETKTLVEWSELSGIPYSTLIQRINKLKWSPKDAITREAVKHE